MKIKSNNFLFFFTKLRRTYLIIVMRVFILLFFTAMFGFTPNNILSQNVKIKIDTDRTLTVDEVFDLIMEQTEYKFIYQQGIFKDFPKVEVKKGTVRVNKLLAKSLEGGDIQVVLGNSNTILIKKKIIDATVTQRLISGTVLDNKNQPLPGATVIEKGTNNGTQTDFDGNFSLTISDQNAVLVISFLGFGTKEIVVNSQTQFQVQLFPEISDLNEVILTGYGSQIRKTLSSSISKLDGEELEGLPVPSFEAGIQGRAAGVQVTIGGAMSGAPVKIRIRGSNSAIASSDPLYVIDGVVVESGTQSDTNPVNGFYMDFGTNVLASINPSDIKSVEILKDAAATSIYGARGSNGVILITTKKGEAGKTKLSLNVDTGISDTTNRIEFVNAKEYLFLAQEAWYNSGNDPLDFWDKSGVLVDGLTKAKALNTDTDWQDQALKAGYSTKVNLSVSGGSEKTSFFISGSVLNEESIFVGNKYIRATARTNIDHRINDNIKLGTTMTYINVDNDYVPVQGGVGQSTAMLPIWPVRKNDGTFFNPTSNPRANIDLWDRNIKSKQFLGSWYLTYKISNGLTFRSDFGLNTLTTFNHQYRDASINTSRLATAYTSQGDRTSWNFKNLLNYSTKLGGHNIDFLIGTESQRTTQKTSLISGVGFSNSTLKTPQDAAEISAIYDESAYTFVSFLSRLNYDFKGKYLLSLTARMDGSSRFGKNSKWGFFPAVSVGYNISEEPYFEPLKKTINFLKVKGSYGVSGNAEIGNYAYASTYSQSNYNGNNGITLANIGDDELGWESTNQLDLGLSFELFDGKIRGEFDYYDKLTKDLLLPYPVSIISGLTQVTTNLGEISNKGFEIMIGSSIIENNNFNWQAELTLARNKNEVLDIGNNPEGLNIPGFGTTSIFVGKPIGIQTIPIWLGIDPVTGLDIYQDKGGNPLRVDQAITEYGSLNNFMNANLVPYGNPFPDISGGINNRFKWKNWYANVLFTFEYGADYIAAGEAINSKYAFSAFNTTPLRYQLNRWRNPGDITDVARLTTDPTIFTRTSQYLSDVDYLRMKDLTIGYILKPKNMRSVESINIYTKLTNYLTFTNAKPWVYDPENYRNSGNLNLLDTWKSSPQAKTITLGLSVNF